MKLVRFGAIGAEKPGVLAGGRVTEVTGIVGDFDATFFAGGGPATLALDLERRPDLPSTTRRASSAGPLLSPGRARWCASA